MVRPLNKKGNALVDLIIAMIILGLVSISVVGAYTSLMSIASNSFRNSQASWFGNSVMEIYSAKAFDDIVENNNFTLNDQFPGYTADITVEPKNVDLSTSTFAAGDGSSKYKEITVTAYNNASSNSFTLKTIISAGVEEGGGADYTFTNCGQEGRSGPSQAQCNAEYAEGVVVTVHNDLGIQEWTVPTDGTYSIEAWGAAGGGTNGGKGVKISADFSLVQGNVILILVGQQGTTSGPMSSGGGGTFVVKQSGSTDILTTHLVIVTPLIISGGGGGSSNSSTTSQNGTTLTSGQTGFGGWGCCKTGGSNGNGGQGTSGAGGGGGGGGFSGNGTGYSPGKSFLNGGTGGVKTRGNASGDIDGSFGGGGGSRNNNNSFYGGGAGGGYSGGGGGCGTSATPDRGGGGGSYCGDQLDGECAQAVNATGDEDAWEFNEGHGKVIITAIG